MSKRSTNLPRRQLGRYLRELRQECGLSLADAARLLDRGAGTLQRLETGETERIQPDLVEELCRIYDSPEYIEPLKGLAQQGNMKSWWHEYGDLIPAGFNVYVGLESAAERLTIYRPDMVSGLFQTPDYARGLDRVYFANEPAEALERRVQLRMRRQSLILRKRRPAMAQLVLDEAVLGRVVGGKRVMAGQLRHLADLPENVTVRVLPGAAGFPLGQSTGPFTILDFAVNDHGEPSEPTIVYVESYMGAMYFERQAAIDLYRSAFGTLEKVALSETDSRHLLRRLAKEYSA
ncbi:helix-turn-helix domain-containing protein [Nocardia niigatensis]|uniref:helix-turn-helix domain-containing protein n=1 Tax=Nocardia niigatensis TaxID=209249 RepID=UPI0009FCFF53|nr:helix-turn-helix transcriptional regulator [Nocardia niigatensis]